MAETNKVSDVSLGVDMFGIIYPVVASVIVVILLYLQLKELYGLTFGMVNCFTDSTATTTKQGWRITGFSLSYGTKDSFLDDAPKTAIRMHVVALNLVIIEFGIGWHTVKK